MEGKRGRILARSLLPPAYVVEGWGLHLYPQALLDGEGKVWLREFFLLPPGQDPEEYLKESLRYLQGVAAELFSLFEPPALEKN